MVIHLVAGCCVHHAHVENSAKSANSLSANECLCQHHHSDELDSAVQEAAEEAGHNLDDASEPSEHLPVDDCDEDRCVVVAASSATAPAFELGQSLASTFECPTLQPVAIRTGWLQRGDIHLRPPSTLFDLHQILLI